MSVRYATALLLVAMLASAGISRLSASDDTTNPQPLPLAAPQTAVIIVDDISAPTPYEVVNPRESEGLTFYVTNVLELGATPGNEQAFPPRIITFPEGEPLAGVTLYSTGLQNDWPHKSYPGLPMVRSWIIGTPAAPSQLDYRVMLTGYYAAGPVDVRFQGSGALAFSRCVSGPLVTPVIPSCLETFDSNLDDDVDLADYAEYQEPLP